jgi:ribosomal protein S18 acetylase RimI-like enzyme
MQETGLITCFFKNNSVYNKHMAAAVTVTTTHIRPLDTHRDLLAVADLIDICFATTMDAEGREYIQHIRRVATDPNYLHWMPGAAEKVSVPMHGYVWVEDGRLVGNLTLIPFFRQGKWLYMIANVAVHPDYRQRGIGHMLTEKALQHIHDHGAASAWLQVRDDNPVAYNLYLHLGFIERAWRTTWQGYSFQVPIAEIPVDLEVTAVANRDWPQQRTWLQSTYPPEVAWNLPFNINHLTPSFWSSLLRTLNGTIIEQWGAYQSNELIGAITWEPSPIHQDVLWVAADPTWEDKAIQALLPVVVASIHNGHSLVINYPAGHAEKAFLKAGFEKHNTLVWMEVKFK